MNLQRLLFVCSALLMGVPDYAVSQSVDAISGTWTGDMAPYGVTPRQPITVELKLEGGALSGTVTGPPQRGTVRTGSFDPATGGLHFEVHVGDGDGSPFVFDGVVVTGTALGRVTGDGLTGDFKITKGTGGAGDPQPSVSGSAAAALRFGFGQVSDWVARAADLVPADRWDYRPAPTVRTYGELIAHVADSFAYYCGRASGRSVQWSDAAEKGSTDKATVTQELERALASCTASYETGGDTGALMENVAHTNLHYGNMITYIRLLGLVPPSS